MLNPEIVNQLSTVFASDSNFSADLARLGLFTGSSIVGMAVHWFKKACRRETESGFIQYFFKHDFKGTLLSMCGSLIFVAVAWTIGLVSRDSVITLLFQGLLCGFCSNSLLNSDGSLRSVSDLAREALEGFQATNDTSNATNLTVQASQVTTHEAAATTETTVTTVSATLPPTGA